MALKYQIGCRLQWSAFHLYEEHFFNLANLICSYSFNLHLYKMSNLSIQTNLKIDQRSKLEKLTQIMENSIMQNCRYKKSSKDWKNTSNQRKLIKLDNDFHYKSIEGGLSRHFQGFLFHKGDMLCWLSMIFKYYQWIRKNICWITYSRQVTFFNSKLLIIVFPYYFLCYKKLVFSWLLTKYAKGCNVKNKKYVIQPTCRCLIVCHLTAIWISVAMKIIQLYKLS